MANAAERQQSLERELPHQSAKSGGLGGEADDALHNAIRDAKRAMPGCITTLKKHRDAPERNSRDAVAACRLLYEIALEAVPEEAKPETRASGKLLLVDVAKATELLRDERMAEQRERQR